MCKQKLHVLNSTFTKCMFQLFNEQTSNVYKIKYLLKCMMIAITEREATNMLISQCVMKIDWRMFTKKT